MMNERISDQVICSEDDVSYSAYDFWYYLTKSKPMESKYKNVWQ